MDANATTPLAPEVFEIMRPLLEGRDFGNASSVHLQGQHARLVVDRAREQVAALLACRAAEIVFTSGGTESDNFALFGVLTAEPEHLRETHLITTAIEHHAVLNAARRLEQRGARVTYLSPDSNGRIRADDVQAAITPQTKLISVMMANNETGVLQPVEEIGRIAAAAGIPFHVDAVQVAGKLPIRVSDIGCSLLSISAHKMHGPQGVGALYVRKGTVLEPLLFGGNHERQRRAGTENVAGIAGLGRAAQLSAESLAGGGAEMIAALRDRLEQGIIARVENCGVNGESAARVPNTSSMWFDHVEGEPLVIALDLQGLAVSSGAACSSGAIEPSHVLLAMGMSPERARSSVRFSLGRHNTDADVDFALQVVPAAIARMRELSVAMANQAGRG
jgi:cysteine desulfurase